MVLGHLTATCAVQQPLKKRFPGFGFEHLGPLIIGAFLPDLIDKPLHLLFGVPTRGFGHSAVLMAVVFYLLIRLFTAYRKVLFALAAGATLHLIEDMAALNVVLWPFLDTWAAEGKRDFALFTYKYYFEFADPLPLLMEVASYPFFLYMLFKRKRLPESLLDNEVSSVQT